MASIADAIAHQTSGIGYQADDWQMVKIPAGSRLYKMMPSNGPYYIDYEAYREFSHTPEAMYGGTQVRVSQRYAMRIVAVEYTVMSDLQCPGAACAANGQHGAGGAMQYFIDEYDRDSHLYQSSPGWGLDGLGIGYF